MALPLEAISVASVHDNFIRHGHPSTKVFIFALCLPVLIKFLICNLLLPRHQWLPRLAEMRAAARSKEVLTEARTSSKHLPAEAFLTPLIELYSSTKPMSVQGTGTEVESLKELMKHSSPNIL